MKQLTRNQKIAIKALKELGESYNEIARVFDVSPSTVIYWVHRNISRPPRTVVTERGLASTHEPYRRPRPAKCELTGEHTDLVYHTWDSYRQRNNPAVAGLWVSKSIHSLLEQYEKGLLMGGWETTWECDEYCRLKEQAEEEVKVVYGR